MRGIEQSVNEDAITFDAKHRDRIWIPRLLRGLPVNSISCLVPWSIFSTSQ